MVQLRIIILLQWLGLVFVGLNLNAASYSEADSYDKQFDALSKEDKRNRSFPLLVDQSVDTSKVDKITSRNQQAKDLQKYHKTIRSHLNEAIAKHKEAFAKKNATHKLYLILNIQKIFARLLYGAVASKLTIIRTKEFQQAVIKSTQIFDSLFESSKLFSQFLTNSEEYYFKHEISQNIDIEIRKIYSDWPKLSDNEKDLALENYTIDRVYHYIANNKEWIQSIVDKCFEKYPTQKGRIGDVISGDFFTAFFNLIGACRLDGCKKDFEILFSELVIANHLFFYLPSSFVKQLDQSFEVEPDDVIDTMWLPFEELIPSF